jgi:hypothetical protein
MHFFPYYLNNMSLYAYRSFRLIFIADLGLGVEVNGID